MLLGIALPISAIAEDAPAEDTTLFTSEVSAGVDFASAYVFHGMTYNSNLCLQPHFSISGLPVILNVWGNYNLGGDTTGMGHFKKNTLTEVDYFFTYLLPFDFAAMDITYGIYTYPETGWDDDGEIQFGISHAVFNLPAEAFFRVGLMVSGPLRHNVYAEGGLRGNVPITEKLSAGWQVKMGYEDQPASSGDAKGIKDLLVTASLSYQLGKGLAATASVNYVGQGDDEVLVDALYDVKFYYLLGINYTF